jgi:hypothetical protein
MKNIISNFYVIYYKWFFQIMLYNIFIM